MRFVSKTRSLTTFKWCFTDLCLRAKKSLAGLASKLLRNKLLRKLALTWKSSKSEEYSSWQIAATLNNFQSVEELNLSIQIGNGESDLLFKILYLSLKGKPLKNCLLMLWI